MLQTLLIKNIATIESAEIPFKKGLNILSGETGAGKSIVIEAISLILGGRASVELIRTGCDDAVVEGLFDLSQIDWMGPRLEKFGLESDSAELIVRRMISRTGKHRIFINGQLGTISMLQEICAGLVDLCGQHEHQSLLKSHTQLDHLDRFGSLSGISREFAEKFEAHSDLLAEQKVLQEKENERRRRADFLEFQIKELRAAELQAGEEVALHSEKQLLQTAEARVQGADSIRKALDEDESGILNSLSSLTAKSRSLAQMDEKFVPLQEGLERAKVEIEEVSMGLSRYLSGVELDPERLTHVQDRLSLLADLRRKYGSTVEEMLESLSQLETEYATLDQNGVRLERIVDALKPLQLELLQIGKRLTESRLGVASLLADSVTSELAELKMSEAEFQIRLTPKEHFEEWTATGADQIQYLVRTNLGDEPKPLGKIASGGELSRLMLAIRRVISDKGGIGVYLFDEIDAGMGGQTAFEVGKKLKSVAQYNQVICITHLPQVASFGDHHLSVRKVIQGKRTYTQVIELSLVDRKHELARMMGGSQMTKKSIDSAGELLDMAKKSKISARAEAART
jgi:DNA repair protein RecN (Recombination protein N)